MKEHSLRRSINRGYMKLEVWQNAIELYKVVWRTVNDANIEFKLRAQISDAAQPVSANIAEGYSRRSINEYIQHLYVALGIDRIAEETTAYDFDENHELKYPVIQSSNYPIILYS